MVFLSVRWPVVSVSAETAYANTWRLLPANSRIHFQTLNSLIKHITTLNCSKAQQDLSSLCCILSPLPLNFQRLELHVNCYGRNICSNILTAMDTVSTASG